MASRYSRRVGRPPSPRRSFARQAPVAATVAGNPRQAVSRVLSPPSPHASRVRVELTTRLCAATSGADTGVRCKHDTQGIPVGRSSNSSSWCPNEAEQNAVNRPGLAVCSRTSNTCTTRCVSPTTPGLGRAKSSRTVIAHSVGCDVRRRRARSRCGSCPPGSRGCHYVGRTW